MKIKAFAVFDASIFASDFSADYPVSNVLELIRAQNIIPLLDKRMMNKYNELRQQSAQDMIRCVIDNGIIVDDIEKVKAELRNQNLIPFFEIKAGGEYPVQPPITNPESVLGVISYLDWLRSAVMKEDIDYDIVINNFKSKHSIIKW